MGTGPSRPRSAPSAREGAPAKRARYHGGRRMGCRGVAILAAVAAHRVCSKLRHGCEKAFDVLGPRQSMVAILHQREDDVVLGKSCGQFDRVLPGHGGVLHALTATGW